MREHKPFCADGSRILFAAGPDLALDSPVATLVDEHKEGDVHTLTLPITSLRRRPTC